MMMNEEISPIKAVELGLGPHLRKLLCDHDKTEVEREAQFEASMKILKDKGVFEAIKNFEKK